MSAHAEDPVVLRPPLITVISGDGTHLESAEPATQPSMVDQ
jgi:hypothetical protein